MTSMYKKDNNNKNKSVEKVYIKALKKMITQRAHTHTHAQMKKLKELITTLEYLVNVE